VQSLKEKKGSGKKKSRKDARPRKKLGLALLSKRQHLMKTLESGRGRHGGLYLFGKKVTSAGRKAREKTSLGKEDTISAAKGTKELGFVGKKLRKRGNLRGKSWERSVSYEGRLNSSGDLPGYSRFQRILWTKKKL